MTIRAADGSMNVTVVSGAAYTGVYAANGNINVVDKTAEAAYVGIYNPCGAWNVTLVASGLVGYYAANGSMNVAVTPYTPKNVTRVTVVSGVL